MSYFISIKCDCCGSALHYEGTLSKEDADKKAKNAGWHIGTQHLCEECQNEQINAR